MKKKIIIPVLALTSILALGGCGSNGEESKPDSVPASSDSSSEGGEMKGHFDHKVTIKFVQSYAQGYQARLQSFVVTTIPSILKPLVIFKLVNMAT